MIILSALDGRLDGRQLTGSFPFFSHAGTATGPFSSFSDAIASVPAHERRLDATALVEIATTGYPFADRTVVESLTRLPFMATHDAQGAVSQHAVPVLPIRDSRPVARTLLGLLEDELARAIAGARRVGVLLSGGMDSRVLAGVLFRLQESGRCGAQVCALTWGTEGSRDVAYAQRISVELGWEWRFVELTAGTLERNIHFMADAGAEVSPLHLHGLPDVGAMDDIDLVLSGTFGDSVGRGEYSGRHVTRLRRHPPGGLDPFGVFPAFVRGSREAALSDATGYRLSVPEGAATWQYREAEHQMHYLRRLLQTTMSSGLGRLPLYQLFTAAPVYEYMLSAPPASRRDDAYRALLEDLPEGLSALPWARTGKPFSATSGKQADALRPSHHLYGEWARTHCRAFIEDAVNQSPLMADRSLARPVSGVLRDWRRSTTTAYTKLDSIVTWLAALGIAMGKYDIAPPLPRHRPVSPRAASTFRRKAYRLARDVR